MSKHKLKTRIANLQLADFLKHVEKKRKKLMKNASTVGNFRDVYTSQDIQAHSRMIAEMLELPKYEAVRRQLTSSGGVVNFVVGNSYAPLWELLLRSAIQPAHNDIYNMGNIATTPNDYFLDSQALFGGLHGQDPREQARSRLDTILFGHVKKEDMEFLRDNDLWIQDEEGNQVVDNLHLLAGRYYSQVATPPDPEVLSEAGIDFILSDLPASASPQQKAQFELIKEQHPGFMSSEVTSSGESRRYDYDARVARIAKGLARRHVNLILQYEAEKARLRQSPLAQAIHELQAQLRNDSQAAAYNAGLSEAEIAGGLGEPQMDPAARKKLITRLAMFRNQYYMAEMELEGRDIYRELEQVDVGFSGAPLRDGGFFSWEPTERLSQLFSVLRDKSKKKDPETFQKMVRGIIDEVANFNTSDPELVKIQSQLVDFIGDSIEETIEMITHSFMRFIQLIEEFISVARRHGQVMILNNFDGCGLVDVSPLDDDCKLNDGGTLVRFNRAFSASMSRNVGSYHTEGGTRKTVILVSEVPIAQLPASSRVTMDTTPVDDAEAEIIVQHLLSVPNRKAVFKARYQRIAELQTKRENGEISKAEYNSEARRIQTEINSNKDAFGTISDTAKQVLIDMIIGESQEFAINAVSRAITLATQEVRNEDGILIGLDVNSETVVTEVTQGINKNADAVPGVSKRVSHVKIEHFIYSRRDGEGKMPAFGGLVEQFKAQARLVNLYDADVNSITAILHERKHKLASGVPEGEGELLASEIAQLEENLQDTLDRRRAAIEDLPHFFILYGPPGTGKTVFADACGDLLGFMIYDVDPSQLLGGIVGDTERHTKMLMDFIFGGGSRRAVFLFDEIDRKLPTSGENEGGAAGRSFQDTQTDISRKILSGLMEGLSDKSEVLVKRNLFIIMTTNNINAVPSALRARQDTGQAFQVEMSTDPADYEKFLRHFLAEEEDRYPNKPWVKGKTPEEGWQITRELVESVDLSAVAAAFCAKRLAFRNLGQAIKQSVLGSVVFREYVAKFEQGQVNELQGVPYTTDNLMLASEFAIANRGASTGAEEETGVYTIRSNIITATNNKLKEAMDSGAIQTETRQDPRTLQEVEFRILPQEIVEFAGSGQVAYNAYIDEEGEGQLPTLDVGEKIIQTPQGPVIQKTLPGAEEPDETEQELTPGFDEGDDSFSDIDLLEDDVTSSTDYLYNCLKKEGLLDQAGKQLIVSKKTPKVSKKQEKVQKNAAVQENAVADAVKGNPFMQWVDFGEINKRDGVFVCDKGRVWIAPQDENSPHEKL